MKNKNVFFSTLSFALFCASVFAVLAKAPETPKIVFSGFRGGNSEIYLMNPDGTQQVNITNDRADDVMPTFSPTGEHILFASDRERFIRSRDLYLMDPDGSNVRRVFPKSKDRMGATWSPDGKQIAYEHWNRGQWYIYIGTIDGKTEERVTIGCCPVWSPDGTEIAFLEGAAGKSRRISILNVQARQSKFFFPPEAPSWVRYAAWSPDGNKLAFTWLNRVKLRVEEFDRETIYIINRDGTGLEQSLGEDGPAAVDPVWSPRGDELLYRQRVHIFKIALDGGEPVQLTHLGQMHHLGDWFDPVYALPVSPQPRLLTTTWAKVKKK